MFNFFKPRTLTATLYVFALSVVQASAGGPQSGFDGSGAGGPQMPDSSTPLVIQQQGGFAFGGTVISDPAGSGKTFHCDHGYAEYQIPVDARKYPILMWHSTSTKTWTGDAAAGFQDGFQQIFTRLQYSVYIIDAPREGRAGDGCLNTTYTPMALIPDGDIGLDQQTFEVWRQGSWEPPSSATFFPNSQAPVKERADYFDQVLRARYPDNEEFPDTSTLETADVKTLLERTGKTVLMTHSGSGISGWLEGIASQNVVGIVSFEPVEEVFPPGEVPPMLTGALAAAQMQVSLDDFKKLTKIPILMIFGDNLDANVPGVQAIWPASFAYAKAFVASINRHGGNATLIHLPDIGIHGNSHLMMLESNNLQIAGIVSNFLHSNKLDMK